MSSIKRVYRIRDKATGEFASARNGRRIWQIKHYAGVARNRLQEYPWHRDREYEIVAFDLVEVTNG